MVTETTIFYIIFKLNQTFEISNKIIIKNARL